MYEPKVLSVEKEDARGYNYENIYTNDKCRRALHKLNDSGMKVYTTNQSMANDIIEDFSESKLEEIDPENACRSHRCH
jgi:predicted Fe-Mo cluster-binding NifX family protein